MIAQIDSVVLIQAKQSGINQVQLLQLLIAILGFGGTIFTLYRGIVAFKRAEQWKKGEFVAQEMKGFRDDPLVQNALKIIDWGDRYVNLFLIPGAERETFVRVTREMQWRALVPHELKYKYPAQSGTNPLVDEGKQHSFTREEAQIRDTYDALFFHLERFYHFVEAGLIVPGEIAPYLRYWLKEIAAFKHEPEDVAWRCALISFIWRYDYQGTVQLLRQLGRPIDLGSECWKSLSAQAAAEPYFADLEKILVSKGAGACPQRAPPPIDDNGVMM